MGDTVAADTAGAASPPVAPPVHVVLRRRPGDEPAEWVRVHTPGPVAKSGARDRSETTYRVAISADGDPLGVIWVDRPRELGDPDLGETQVIAAANMTTELHKKSYTWWHLLWLIPIFPTGTEYTTVVINRDTVHIPQLYHDFFTAVQKRCDEKKRLPSSTPSS